MMRTALKVMPLIRRCGITCLKYLEVFFFFSILNIVLRALIRNTLCFGILNIIENKLRINMNLERSTYTRRKVQGSKIKLEFDFI